MGGRLFSRQLRSFGGEKEGKIYVDDEMRASSWSGTCSIAGHIEEEVVMCSLWLPQVRGLERASPPSPPKRKS